MAAPQAAPVELGFAEEAPAWRLRSEQFPSKVGGRPAWLGAAGLPGPGALACALCGRPLAFLLQVYAPLPDRDDAFHRALFLFCCREPPCCAGLRVFRNQLPRKNDFYSYEPPPDGPAPGTGEAVCLQLQSGAHLCRVCGCLGPKACSRCHKAYYCSREHQMRDWRMGHKQACAEPDHLDHVVPDHNFLFPEFEIVIESEDEFVPEVVEKEDDSDITESMGEALEEELDSMAKHESEEDKIFQKFKTQIAVEPEQILRYGRGITPIWISGENIPHAKDIPDCPCGAKRILEFQVMPQLLNYLKADSLGHSVDWGILTVFTCAESCSLGSGYAEEFVWKQDFADTR
ncbi:programmed cell death protein 2 isoform X1 [Ochotona curzoniae]|uniref:programmed cell death protein 2 isoform X1 n=1 Tax=Ochotona curzoniae TaxID=130825 RepID=UPI001B34B9B4|nr:programmed cell death protein 2 isoform X1 [Ochotona curzoniae]XP_040821625.1 programmed cell death protein 2 isoform X1 [Ochotona curzoniae]XP_040821626.1 programmed cell death protein 2 isoform X1 [Ochotona curzoniae]